MYIRAEVSALFSCLHYAGFVFLMFISVLIIMFDII